jgi:hypothetical protein
MALRFQGAFLLLKHAFFCFKDDISRGDNAEASPNTSSGKN